MTTKDKALALVLQVELADGQWACIYRRDMMPEHFTADKRLDPLITKFIEHKKGGAA